MSRGDEFLNQRLREREGQRLLRTLAPKTGLADFASNDYLGFARSEELKKKLEAEVAAFRPAGETGYGSTGSRLLTGNSLYAENLETFIARFHKAEAALIFNSGFDANAGLISSVARKEDVILYDELAHASIYDGVRLSKAESFPFRHNDTAHLEERLEHLRGRPGPDAACFVLVESLYSMDGDFAPLKEMAALCKKYGASLIADEAHATGIYGPNGEGKVVELGLEKEIFARVHTFGKALGCHGAAVLGSQVLRQYLINFARTFIYTTALPFHSLAAIKAAYLLLQESNHKILKTKNLITSFKLIIYSKFPDKFSGSDSPIQSIILPGNETVKQVSSLIRKDGFDVRPILSPTVPKGKERIRICLHAFNTEEEIAGLVSSLKKHSARVPHQQPLP